MTTALDMSREQLQQYIKAYRKRPTPEPAAEDLAARDALLETARLAARLLKEKYGAQRVFLFGSLAHRAWFGPESDVDIVVMGIGKEFWRAWAEVEPMFPGRSVDLIDWESASESLKQAVKRKGIEL